MTVETDQGLQTVPYLATSRWPPIHVGRGYEVQLGKMLQPQSANPSDRLAPYLKAAHVQWNGLTYDRLPEMYCSSLDEAQYRVAPGDLLVCEGGDAGRPAMVQDALPEHTIIQNSVHRVRPRPGFSTRYLYFVLTAVYWSGWLDVLCNRATIAHFTREKLAALLIPAPPLSQQRAIADFLDRETAQIDHAIELHQRPIELLGEKRRSVLHSLVRTLTCDVSVEQTPLRYVLRPKEITGHPESTVLSLYRDRGVIPKESRTDNFNKTPLDLTRYQLVEPGDVVVNKMKAWQGSIAVSGYTGIVSPDYLVCAVTRDVNLKYLHHILRSPPMAANYAKFSTGIRPAQWRLYWEDMATIRIPIPSAERQAEVADRLDRVDEMIAKEEGLQLRAASLWVERRQALITAAVTGQLDIAEAAASPLPPDSPETALVQ